VKKSQEDLGQGKEFVGFKVRKTNPQQPSSTLTAKVDNPVFSALFLEKLKKLFLEEQWQYHWENEQNQLTLIHPENESRLQILKTTEGIKFNSFPQSEKDIALAANAYREACLEENKSVTFMTHSSNEQDAVEFVRKLKQQGFDLSQISEVHFESKVLSKDELSKWLKANQLEMNMGSSLTAKTSQKLTR